MSALSARIRKLEAALPKSPDPFAHLTADQLIRAIAVHGRISMEEPTHWTELDRSFKDWREQVMTAEAYVRGEATLADCGLCVAQDREPLAVAPTAAVERAEPVAAPAVAEPAPIAAELPEPVVPREIPRALR